MTWTFLGSSSMKCFVDIVEVQKCLGIFTTYSCALLSLVRFKYHFTTIRYNMQILKLDIQFRLSTGDKQNSCLSIFTFFHPEELRSYKQVATVA